MLQFCHGEYVMGKFNLLLYLGGKEVCPLFLLQYYVRCPFFSFYQCEMSFFSVNVSCPSQMANYTEDDGIGGWGLFGRD